MAQYRYTVTKQLSWQDGLLRIEIAYGNFDHSSPGMIGNWSFETNDPWEASEVAIEKLEDCIKGPTGPWAISIGSNCDESTIKEVKEWADKQRETIAQCAGCENLMPPNKRDYWRANDWDGLEYCCEYCADRAREFEEQENTRCENELHENT